MYALAGEEVMPNNKEDELEYDGLKTVIGKQPLGKRWDLK